MMLHYELEGPDDAPVILFSNSLGTTSEMWQPQRDALIGTYRLLRYDVPGHGASAPNGQTRSLEQLGIAVLSLLDLGWQPGEDGTGILTLSFAGDGTLAIDAECLSVDLRDVTRPYLAVSGDMPRHE